MSTLTTEFDKFVQSHSTNGNNTIETERQIASVLAERELDRNLALAEEDIKAGRYTVVNEKTTEEFMNRLAKKLLSNHK